MTELNLDISLTFQHRIRFTKNVFDLENETISKLVSGNRPAKVIVFVENEIVRHFPQLESEISQYLQKVENLNLSAVHRAEGGEYCKRSEVICRDVMDAIEKHKIDRHSYVFAIGGGAFLDVVGFAAATAHRGIRLLRFPTTTLAQDDSGVGVKNGINLYRKKNFLGTFAVPYAVINDFNFLHTQPAEIRREGLIEAVKVALVKDSDFFQWLEGNAQFLFEMEESKLEEAVERSATLHAHHIAYGGDPFELGSSRPLDYGHWAAHKLEQITDFRLSHAQAVSIGIALDSLYAVKCGELEEDDCNRIIKLIQQLGLPIWDEALETRAASGRHQILEGLEEFREHLGGQLTVMLLSSIGTGFDVHEMDEEKITECISELKKR